MANEGMPVRNEVLNPAIVYVPTLRRPMHADWSTAGPKNSKDPPRAKAPTSYTHKKRPSNTENGVQPGGDGRKTDHGRAGGVAASDYIRPVVEPAHDQATSLPPFESFNFESPLPLPQPFQLRKRKRSKAEIGDYTAPEGNLMQLRCEPHRQRIKFRSDPTSLVRRLLHVSGGDPSVVASISQCLNSIIADKDARAFLLSRTGTDAEHLVPLLQWWVSAVDSLIEDTFRRKIVALLVKLSVASGVLPRELFIQGVSIGDDRDPWTSGGFADVFQGVYNHQPVAVKRLRVLNEDKEVINPLICREALLWRQLNHPHILPFLGVDAETFASRSALCLVSPWMERGTLKQYITSASYDSSGDRDRLLHEIAQGIGYLHDENMVHGDINWVNIFVDDRSSARIADFGLAVISEVTGGGTTATHTGLKGTVAWMSPERINGASRLAPSMDVYSFGILWLTMWTRTRPFQKLGEIATLMRVTQGGRPQRPVPEDCQGETLSEDVWALVEKCWAQDPLARPHMAEVVESTGEILDLRPWSRPGLARHSGFHDGPYV